MPGILARLGSFGMRIVRSAIETGRTLAETVGFVRPIAPTVTIEAAAPEWGHVSRSEEAEPTILAIPDTEYVPDRLHMTFDIPWRRKYCYTVSIYGRDLATGRFAREDYDLTMSKKMTIGEIKDVAGQRIGKAGVSAAIDIFDIEVSNAWEREE